MDGKGDFPFFVCSERKACFGVDGSFSYGNGNRQKIGFLPIEHFV